MIKPNNIKVKITELFMAKAGIGMKGFDRCFYGTIKRIYDDKGLESLVIGRIPIKTLEFEGYIVSKGKDQWQLGAYLDELVILLLDKNIHSSPLISPKYDDILIGLN